MQRSVVLLTGLAALTSVLIACGRKQPEAPPPTPARQLEQPAGLPQPDYDIPMRNFAPLAIGPYEVQPMFEEEIEDGHYNIKITGAEVRAVRIWVGPEDASGVMVVRTEIENDYHHGHLEVPSPIPPDAVLWIEIETPEGDTLKGSTPLRPAE